MNKLDHKKTKSTKSNNNKPQCFKKYIKDKIHPKYKQQQTYTNDDNLYYNLEHAYSISTETRIDLTNVSSFSVDPDGCTDVDDAFSIWRKENGDAIHLYLAIHIADPTHFFSPYCPIYEKIKQNNFTHYPSNKSPLHMMPKAILEYSNLYTTENIAHKNAATIIFRIDENTYLPIDYEIVFSRISVSKFNKHSYNVIYKEETDLTHFDTFDKIISCGIKISEALREKRNSVIQNLVDFNKTQIKYIQNSPHFVNTTESAMKLKIMIEEFAILSNGVIGKYLYDTNKFAFYRSCALEQPDLQLLQESEKTSDELLEFIITNGVQAYYNKNDGEHNLVNTQHYTHFTSPLRRFSDCITHFILKSTLYNLPLPFTSEQLDYFSQYSNSMNKIERKIQFEDKKVVALWAIHNLIQQCTAIKNNVFANIKFISSKNGFLSFLIYNLIVKDEKQDIQQLYYTHISYSLRIFDYPHIQYWLEHVNEEIEITEVNCIKKFDIGILPDIERKIKNPYR